MFGLSMTEILVVLVLGLVVLGPERIPQVAKTLGKALREVRKASNVLRDAMMIEDAPVRPKPVVRTPQAADQAFDQSFDSPALTQKSGPAHDVKLSPMTAPKRSLEFLSVEVQAGNPPEAHRDVYLHIPYQETL
jgi:TatA/E family protein of Tat protein translocase